MNTIVLYIWINFIIVEKLQGTVIENSSDPLFKVCKISFKYI